MSHILKTQPSLKQSSEVARSYRRPKVRIFYSYNNNEENSNTRKRDIYENWKKKTYIKGLIVLHTKENVKRTNLKKYEELRYSKVFKNINKDLWRKKR